MKILIWGTGSGAEKFLSERSKLNSEILAFIDSDKDKWGKSFKNKEIISPNDLDKFNYDYILISSSFYLEINFLYLKHIDNEKILNYSIEPLQALEKLGEEIYFEVEDHRLVEDQLVTDKISYRVEKKFCDDIDIQPDSEDIVLAGKLLSIFHEIKNKQIALEKKYNAGSNWDGVFKRTRKDFYQIVQENDEKKLAELLANFSRNCLTTSMMGSREGFLRFCKAPIPNWIDHNLNVWRAATEQKFDIKKASLSKVGNIYGYIINGALINWNSFPNHYRAYYCLELLKGINKPVVAEIGGGYGGFAYFLQKLSDVVTYINFDLPENLIVSSYFLSKNYPEKKILYYSDDIKTLDSDIISEYDIILMPNFMIKNLADLSVDLFINTISFSEMDITTVAEYFLQIERTCRYYLYHENLTCTPKYKGYPVSVFPELKNFKCIMNASNRWMPFDAYSKGHSYFETLLIRNGVTVP